MNLFHFHREEVTYANKIPNDLPASKILKEENIFVMDETRALSQRIRPLKLLLLILCQLKS